MPNSISNDTLSQAHVDVDIDDSDDLSVTANIATAIPLALQCSTEEAPSKTDIPNKRKSSSREPEISQPSKRRRMSVAERDIELHFFEN